MMSKDKENNRNRKKDKRITRKRINLSQLFPRKRITLWQLDNLQQNKSNRRDKRREFNYKLKNKDQNKQRKSPYFNTRRNNSKNKNKRKSKNKDLQNS